MDEMTEIFMIGYLLQGIDFSWKEYLFQLLRKIKENS